MIKTATIEAELEVPEVKDVDPEQLKKGIEIEKEHTDDEEVARTVALAHLKENPKYYDYLDEMEKKMKKAEALAPSEEEVKLFIKHHPNPDDDTLHNWAELHGYDPHEVEEVVYRILTRKLNERIIYTPVFGQTIIMQRGN